MIHSYYSCSAFMYKNGDTMEKIAEKMKINCRIVSKWITRHADSNMDRIKGFGRPHKINNGVGGLRIPF